MLVVVVMVKIGVYCWGERVVGRGLRLCEEVVGGGIGVIV